jgi:hypothetical protein
LVQRVKLVRPAHDELAWPKPVLARKSSLIVRSRRCSYPGVSDSGLRYAIVETEVLVARLVLARLACLFEGHRDVVPFQKFLVALFVFLEFTWIVGGQ